MSATAVSQMRKEEAIDYLWRKFGVEADPRWTSVEVKEKIRQLTRDEGTHEVLRGISSAKRAELANRCEKMGIKVTGNTTRGAMMIELRRAVFLAQPVKDGDLVSFGKHHAVTYQWLMQNEPKYIKWVKDTADGVLPGDGWPAQELRRLRRCIKAKAEGAAASTTSRSRSPVRESPARGSGAACGQSGTQKSGTWGEELGGVSLVGAEVFRWWRGTGGKYGGNVASTEGEAATQGGTRPRS